jgi:MOSC domain-containing protein YiiM
MKNEVASESRIYKLSISTHTGEKKENVPSVKVVIEKGIEGDAHFGSGRPISLLPYESFSKLDQSEIRIDPGDFAENITTEGVDFSKLDIGSKIALGDTVILEVMQIGKECHNDCVIRQTVGDCIMPREGVFAKPLKGGMLREGDPVKIFQSHKD